LVLILSIVSVILLGVVSFLGFFFKSRRFWTNRRNARRATSWKKISR
jgi:hypothetical protein